MREVPKVALLIETARGYGRQFLHGIARYSRLHGPWGFYVTPSDFKQSLPQMQRWGGTGIIARIETPRIAQAILDSGLPTIALDLTHAQMTLEHPLSGLSEVSSDSWGAGQLAAEHLMQRGFHHFAYVGIAGRVWSQIREESFCEAIAATGLSISVYKQPRAPRNRKWDREQPILSEWLSKLPKPIGVMACNDDRGREVLEACRDAEIEVPEQIAVIGVDNDDLLCELTDPPLSSVALDAEQTGYQAAGLLDRMMKQPNCKPRRLQTKTLHVVARRSTDRFVVDDPEVSAALRFIHDHATEAIQVEDIVRGLAISRRNLEIRFHNSLGRTVHSELHRQRMERARRFLTETNLPIPKIAEHVGYGTPSYFIQTFRKEHDVTPAKYRKRFRGGE